jgi:alpha-tubulin suppressor-like RCC1 family protein
MIKLLPYFVGFALLTSCVGEPTSPPPDPIAPSLATTTATLPFAQVSAGYLHTCGLTTGSKIYCWGYNGEGQLGNGTTNPSTFPTLVAGGLLFRGVSAGQNHTCGVTTGFRVYCWGYNGGGQLGDGTNISTRLLPVPVAGGRPFRLVSAAANRTCALTTATATPANKIYCWGSGYLGNGTSGKFTTPQLVNGARTYRQMAAGNDHTCGVTTAYQVFCWGSNTYGQLGNGPTLSFAVNPVKVAGQLQYLQVSAGEYHTCAVTTTKKAYCWGNNGNGRIGDGTTTTRFTPRAVAGGLSFDRVSASWYHTCGETSSNQAYCWGYNEDGELGDGTTSRRLTPTRVQGGLFFKQVDAGSYHTCGVASGSQAYCWGHNGWGQLGIGTYGNQYLSPEPVQY